MLIRDHPVGCLYSSRVMSPKGVGKCHNAQLSISFAFSILHGTCTSTLTSRGLTNSPEQFWSAAIVLLCLTNQLHTQGDSCKMNATKYASLPDIVE